MQSTVGFNYRNAPAVQAARELIRSGELGSITHARFRLFSDYAAHPEGALSWRYERERGGSGVLGDLASHGVDLAGYLLGDIDSLVADTATFLTERARPTGATSGHARASGGEMGPVENEDYVSSLLRFASGARGTLEASRVAVGEQNNYGFEIHGTKGAVFWDFRRMGELAVSTGTKYQDQPVSTVFVGPADGDYAAFQPGSANSMGYDDLKVIEAYNFLRSIAEGKPYGATVDDAVRSAVALDAMVESAASGTWVSLRMTVRVGVIGAGIMGADHANTLHRMVSGAEVSLIADVDPGRAQDVAGKIPGSRATGNALELIADDAVDAVLIASHDSTHRELVLAAVRAGKPVLCEKPLAPTLAECVEVVAAEAGRGGAACR